MALPGPALAVSVPFWGTKPLMAKASAKFQKIGFAAVICSTATSTLMTFRDSPVRAAVNTNNISTA